MHKTITLSSVHEHLEQIVEEAEAFVTSFSSDEDLVYRVVLLTTEAVTNAMKHGNRFDPDKLVTVAFKALDDRIEIDVSDEGEGFNWQGVRNPLEEENLMRDSGRGVYLIEALADEFRYEMGGRKLHMVFRLPDQ